MYPILFRIWGIYFYTHGFMIALGAAIGGLIIFYLAKREKISRRFLFDVLVYSLFAGLVGARIFYVVLYYYQFSNWQQMIMPWYGGMVSFGGIIFGFLVAGLILKKLNQNILKWFDLGVIGLLAGWSIGRIGCLLTNDVLGVISFSKIAIFSRIPVSLIESIWAFLLACLLSYLMFYQKKFLEKFNDGFLFFLGLDCYFLGRFVIDFWRDDKIFWILKISQIGSLILFLIITIILLKYYLLPIFKKRKE